MLFILAFVLLPGVSRVVSGAHFHLLAPFPVDDATFLVLNAALLASNWQHRAWTVPFHPSLPNTQLDRPQIPFLKSLMCRPFCRSHCNWVSTKQILIPCFARLSVGWIIPARSGNSRMKKLGGQHKCLPFMVIFCCKEDWFAVINPIKPNIGLFVNIVRTVARKSSNRLKFCWLKVNCCVCQSNEVEREIKHKTGGNDPPSPSP